PKSKYKRENFVSAPKSVAYIDADIYYPLAIYVGVYDIIDRTMPISVMYDRATMAMNSIKGDYRQRVANYTDELRKKAMIDQNMISKFDVALQNGDIKMFLQPQVNDKGEVVGAEALARWVDPEKGIIPPIDFIPLIEKNGMIGKLDVYMWRLACSRLAMWKKMGVDMNISVNISPKDFYYMDLNKIFRNYIKIYDITPNKLHLEITETAVITNVAKQVLLINNLKELGYVVEMDDFGSGYSSLNMLKDIPVDVVKIDMAFLQKSDNVSKAKKILSAIIALCKELDMKTVVEGVEDSNQLAFLLDEGADLFQGYFYSKPIPVEEFEEKYIPDYEEKKKLLKDYEEVEVVI
ncbi:MAG TPA: diguanylate cyclase, partial [Lachnospiraceae bacterium]|nr:diguanylate cyclase [Lachnospiraceae bacterium]